MLYNFTAGTGNDVFTLGQGNYIVNTGGGTNIITVNNSLATSTSTYSLTGGAGNDSITLGYGNYTVIGGGGNDTIAITNQGKNTLSFAGATNGISADLSTNTYNEGAYGTLAVSGGNFQGVIGSANDDTLKAGAATTSMDGGTGGNDTFDLNYAGTVASKVILTGSATGANVLTFANVNKSGVVVDFSTNTVSGSYGNATIASANIKSVIGSGYSESITLTNTSVAFDGMGGGDTVIFGTNTTSAVTYSAGAKSYNLNGLTANLHNISVLDLSKNTNTGNAGYNYTLSAADIVGMMTGPGSSITIKTYTNDKHTVTGAGLTYTEVSNGTGFTGTITGAGGSTYTVQWQTVTTH